MQPWHSLPTLVRQGRELEAARAYCSDMLRVDAFPAPLLAYTEPTSVGVRLARVERFVSHFKQHTAIDLVERCRPRVEALLGGGAVLFKDKINFRHPGALGFAPHQDAAAGWSRYASRFASVTIFLEDSSDASGGFEFATTAPPDCFLPNVDGRISERLFVSLAPVRVHALAGSGILFDAFVPHRTMINAGPYFIPHIILTFNRASEGEHRQRYYDDKTASMRSLGNGAYEFRLFRFV